MGWALTQVTVPAAAVVAVAPVDLASMAAVEVAPGVVAKVVLVAGEDGEEAHPWGLSWLVSQTPLLKATK